MTIPSSPSLPRARALRALLFLLGCLIAASACGGAPTKPAGTALPVASRDGKGQGPALQLDPRVISGRLKNGLSYFLQQHRVKDHRAHVVLMVKAGSVYEQEDERGLAHFIEHMAFNGTKRYPKQTLVEFFERNGLRFGAHVNAATSYDRTQYQAIVPTDDPQQVIGALNVLVDWASQISFDPEELESERKVLAAEWTSSRAAARRVGEQQRQLLLAGSRFAEREVLGDKAVLETAPRERLLEFYRRWYRPERMAVIVAGDIDPSAVQVAIQERFSSLAGAGAAPEEPRFDIALRPGTSAAVITDPEAAGTAVDIVLEAPARLVHSEADFRAQLVSVLGTLMLTSRLEEITDNPLAPFTNASSGLSPAVLGRLDLLQVSAQVKERQVEKSLPLLLDELERVRRHGFTRAELKRVKEQYLRFLDQAVAKQDSVELSALTAALANHFVTGNAVTSPDLQRKLGLQLMRSIDASEIKAAFNQWLTASQQLVMVSGATRDTLPEEAEVLAAVAAAKQRTVAPYEEPAPPGALLASAPTPGQVVKEEQIAEIGVTVWTLSNGARVVLKPTDFKRDQILEQSISYGGNAREPASDYPSVRVAHEVVAVSGAGQLDRAQLTRSLDGKLVSAYPWIDEQNEGIRASAAPKDAETMFQLLHALISAPRRDEAAFAAYQTALREGLRNRELNPTQVFSDAIARKLWGDTPRRLPPTLASVDQMKLDVALDFYKQRFSDVSDFTFVFVGQIELDRFRALTERYLASLPGAGRKEKPVDFGLHRRPGAAEVRVRQGKDDKASVSLVYHGESRWSESAQTDLTSLESYLTLRLREVLREQTGGAYAPFVSNSFERVPYDAYTLAISFECKSADVERLLKATRATISELKKAGVPAAYVEKLRAQRTRELEELYRDNAFWLERLVDKFKMDEDPRTITSLPQLTPRITSENLRLAARHFLRDDQVVEAILTPEAGAATGTPRAPATPKPVTPKPAAPATPAAPAQPKAAAAARP